MKIRRIKLLIIVTIQIILLFGQCGDKNNLINNSFSDDSFGTDYVSDEEKDETSYDVDVQILIEVNGQFEVNDQSEKDDLDYKEFKDYYKVDNFESYPDDFSPHDFQNETNETEILDIEEENDFSEDFFNPFGCEEEGKLICLNKKEYKVCTKDKATGELVWSDPFTCEDYNECTDESCSDDVGCVVNFNSNFCDDGDPCTEYDKCVDGKCVGTPKNCEDYTKCTNDFCDNETGECVHIEKSKPQCKDKGVCEGITIPIICNENTGEFQCNYAVVPNYSPSEDGLCDGLDNNCDGVVDEGFSDFDNDGITDCVDDDDDNDGVPDFLDCEPLNPEIPSCANKECGDNGCGESCGECNDNNSCTDDFCVEGKCQFVEKEKPVCKNKGVCKGFSIPVLCNENSGEFECDYSTVPGFSPDEVNLCDYLDNDCDGITDEGCGFEYNLLFVHPMAGFEKMSNDNFEVYGFFY